MHTSDEEPNFHRGYEWAVMKEAKARNPDIILYALPWAWPGWLKVNGSNNPLLDNTNKTADYVAKWVDGEQRLIYRGINHIMTTRAQQGQLKCMG
jgi:galactosylceramidase